MLNCNSVRRRLLRTLQANIWHVWIWWWIPNSTQAQVVRDYRVTSTKPFKFEWVSDYRPIKTVDTVKLIQKDKAIILQLQCVNQEFALSTKLGKVKVKVGDTLQAVLKL